MNKILKEKIMEAFYAVLPITVIVLIVSVFLTSLPSGTILMFIGGAAMMIVGMGFFTLGADMAMIQMGEGVGVHLTKSSKLYIIIIITFIIGLIITVAEPDLQLLARKVPSIPNIKLIMTVSFGVGIFLVIAILRSLFKIRLSLLLLFFYIVTFTLAYFTPMTFVPVAFDSGGVTTGPITVPFILAMGAGIASIRSDKDSMDDSFGLVALCSVGPILAVLLLGIFYKPESIETEKYILHDVQTSREAAQHFANEMPKFIKDVSLALGAIILFFITFQLFTRRYHRRQLARIIIGFVYTWIGLVIFLTGVNVGFIPVGEILGSQLAASDIKWILIPLGIVIGYYIVAAEPAVHVLNKQVEEISSGAITVKMMSRGLAIGMASALAITMTRILLHIPIMWILIPGYAFALGLTFFVPRIFTGIAFDSGGVCSGPMSTTFLLPFAIGACNGLKGNILVEAFGIIAVIAMTPLIVIQLMGLIYKIKTAEAEELTFMQTKAIASTRGVVIDWGKIHVYGEAD